MFAGIHDVIGTGVGTWQQDRRFALLDQQPVIRQNRDTFYSVSIADISAGAVLTLPDAGVRYWSAMVINEDHINGPSGPRVLVMAAGGPGQG